MVLSLAVGIYYAGKEHMFMARELEVQAEKHAKEVAVHAKDVEAKLERVKAEYQQRLRPR